MRTNLQRAMDFIQGRPSGEVVWNLGSFSGACFSQIVPPNPTHADRVTAMVNLGNTFIWHGIQPWKETWDGLEVKTRRVGGDEITEWTCAEGRLTERKREGQVLEFKLKSPDDLRVYAALLRRVRIEADPEAYRKGKEIAAGGPYNLPPQPLGVVGAVSPVQHLIQMETGVADFYYLMTDDRAALEEVMELMQDHQRQRYAIAAQWDFDVYYQGENTSTTMISPEFYERYSLPQIRDLVEAAHRRGRRAIVHMCGLLKGLLPLIRRTGMDGIHSLTSPPVGDVPFDDIYERFPADFSILGRMNTNHWLGKTKESILSELRRLFPARLFAEHPFMIWLTLDSVPDIPKSNFDALLEALREFNRDVQG